MLLLLVSLSLSSRHGSNLVHAIRTQRNGANHEQRHPVKREPAVVVRGVLLLLVSSSLSSRHDSNLVHAIRTQRNGANHEQRHPVKREPAVVVRGGLLGVVVVGFVVVVVSSWFDSYCHKNNLVLSQNSRSSLFLTWASRKLIVGLFFFIFAASQPRQSGPFPEPTRPPTW